MNSPLHAGLSYPMSAVIGGIARSRNGPRSLDQSLDLPLLHVLHGTPYH